MLDTARALIKEFEEEGWHYEHEEATEEFAETVRIPFSLENNVRVKVIFFFDDNNQTVNIKVFSLCQVKVEKLMDMYVLLNQLNYEYRWVTFYLDQDNEVTLSGDAVVDVATAGAELKQLCGRFLSIIEDIYPRLMKVIWG